MLNDLPVAHWKDQVIYSELNSHLKFTPYGQSILKEIRTHGWDILTYEIRKQAFSGASYAEVVGYGCYVIDEDRGLILAEERDTLLVEAIAKALLRAQIKPLRAEDV